MRLHTETSFTTQAQVLVDEGDVDVVVGVDVYDVDAFGRLVA
ncbi:MAG: hypothetical protein QOG01_1684 [Pseudonocardiales bacterium]|nr:hypothetical protein [Pseudonocardiales bacterium]